MLRTTPAQIAAMEKAVNAKNALINEQVWSLLVAALFDSPDQERIIERLCGEKPGTNGLRDIWYEAEPMPPRKGGNGVWEGNTMLDLAFGHIVQRGVAASGIAYGPHVPGSWVCFVEAKCLSDSSTRVAYDPLRNQLARVIENLLCFQSNGVFPERLYFTLLTPRLFMKHPASRLYGYKISEYLHDPSAVRRDIQTCCIPERNEPAHIYPDLDRRLAALKINWVAFEDLLEPKFGLDLDIVGAPKRVRGIKDSVSEMIRRLQTGASGV